MVNVRELGGFAEYEDDIDGTIEEFYAFNYCLAEEYANAMYREDFEELGTISLDLLYKICYWIDYDNKHENQELREQIKNGNIITCNNRTFIEAIYANKNAQLAETYLRTGIKSAKLILTIVLSKETEADYEPLAFIGDEYYKQEDFNKIFNDLYNLIEYEYCNSDNKKEFLDLIKNNYARIRCYKTYKSEPIPIKYHWVQDIKHIIKDESVPKSIKKLKKSINRKK